MDEEVLDGQQSSSSARSIRIPCRPAAAWPLTCELSVTTRRPSS